MEHKDCVLIKKKEYKELLDKIKELEEKTKPDALSVSVGVVGYGKYHQIESTIDLSEGLRDQIRKILFLLKEDVDKGMEDWRKNTEREGAANVLTSLRKKTFFSKRLNKAAKDLGLRPRVDFAGGFLEYEI